MGDVSSSNFFRSAPGPGWLVISNTFLFLAKQRDELEGSLADLYTSCEFVEKALKHGSETEILLVMNLHF